MVRAAHECKPMRRNIFAAAVRFTRPRMLDLAGHPLPTRARVLERPPGQASERCPRSRSLMGGIDTLQKYKMAFLDKLDFAVTTRDFDAADDAAALAHAYTLCGTHQIAVTQDGRLVGEVAKGAVEGEGATYV